MILKSTSLLIVALMFATVFGLGPVCLVFAADQPPNLLVILTDDLGYADVGFNGCQDIPTPNIDRIAQNGVRCTSGYATYAVCGPSRAGLITGRYQDRFGACRNPTIDPSVPNNGVPVSEKNIAELLKPVGYTSMAVGKWHLGTHPDLRPRVRGFDEFFGFLSGGHEYFPEALDLEDLSEVKQQWDWYRTKLLHNETPIKTNKYLTDELSCAGVDFIEREHQEPFFLYMAYNAPHTPLQATKKYLDRFLHIEDIKRRTYAAMVSAVDDGVGKLLDILAKHDLEKNTIVFFLSDNGGATNNASNNNPLRGHKSDPFEGGIRVPFAVQWPGTLPAGIDYELPISALDIAATITAQAKATVSPQQPLDGVDLIPYLTNGNEHLPHRELFWRWYDQGHFVVRLGSHKYILMNDEDGSNEKDNDECDSTMLFNLKKDIGEKDNILHDHESVATKAKARLDKWSLQLSKPIAPGLGSWRP